MSLPAKGQRLLIFGTMLAYGLIGVEIIIMISPFALYFYSVYAPILHTLAASPLTAWSTEFFLPHMVFVADPLVNAISYLQLLLVVGLLLFFTAAVPLYYGRFTGKGVVQASFYGKIRHPQYLFLAISGFGLMLYWPRFIILIMYITMLFVYYLLARNEEWRMKHEVPQIYEQYMANTPMFLPGEPGKHLFSLLFGWLRPKWLGILAAYLASLALAVGLALVLRSHTVETLPTTVADDALTLVSVFPRPANELLALYRIVEGDSRARELIRQKEANVAYVMPGDFFLTALVTDENRRFSDHMIERFPEILEWHQHKFSGGLGKFFRIFYNFIRTLGTVETDYEIERLVFVRVTHAAGQPAAPGEVFDVGLKRLPVLLVDIGAHDHAIHSVLPTSDNHKWGRVPMPTF